VPEAIIKKPPSPALWPGQTAEEELGTKYELLDLILYGLERFMPENDIAKQLGTNEKMVKRVRNTWLSSEHKRRMLLTTKLEYRTIGMDFRLRRG
jgi:NAD+ synthase